MNNLTNAILLYGVMTAWYIAAIALESYLMLLPGGIYGVFGLVVQFSRETNS